MSGGLTPHERELIKDIHSRVVASSNVTWHLRRNMPLYLVALLVLALVVVAPTRQLEAAQPTAASAPVTANVAPLPGAGSSSARTGQVGAAQGVPGGQEAAVADSPGAARRGDVTSGLGNSPSSSAPGSGPAAAPGGTGAQPTAAGAALTKGGFACEPGVRQIPWSAYARECVPAWSGDNGGETYPGVTAETIKVVIRSYADNADAQAQRAVLNQAGATSEPGAWQKRFDAYVAYFNEAFETYGRRVEFELYTSAANQFDEVNGEGREVACADATRIKEELGAFMTLSGTGIMYGPYADCAVERGMVLPIGPYGFPHDWYAEAHPHAFSVQMDCTRSSELYAEYIIKRIAGDRAVWARDPLYKEQERVFGAIYPDIEYYMPCNELFARRMEEAGITIASEYVYVLDPARLQAQATQAAIQMKADGVTTVMAATDFLTMISLTEAADQQNWGPEWLLQGSGLQDDNRYARLYNQDAADGHMFGQSIQGDTALRYGVESESAETYRRITGEEAPEGTDGWYFDLVQIFNMIQGAGPNLTPATIAEGMARMTDGGPPVSEFGYWSFTHASDGTPGFLDYSAVDDVREIYWDGSRGTFMTTYDGRRFRVGEWPREAPPIYPDR